MFLTEKIRRNTNTIAKVLAWLIIASLLLGTVFSWL
ncbi:MAG: hypothetical protein K0R93_324 [Anaerosolibacter sp.]|jgi:hypothetical protein|nr:hypothetical protein [Anaerosolibacter sp.]